MECKVIPTKIEGMYEVNNSYFFDKRGYFLNAFRANEDFILKTWGSKKIKQVNISRTKDIGSIRGLHLQKYPFSELKMIRCIKGRVWDVGVDLRKNSETFLSWHSVELSAEKGNAFIIPQNCAHGFQVLEEDSEILYLHSGEWKKEYEIGVIWNDPDINVKWPLKETNISKRDMNLPRYKNL